MKTTKTPTIEPSTQKFLDFLAAAGGPPIYTLSPEDARNVLSSVQSGEVTKMPADSEDRSFPVGPTGQTRVRILRPQGSKEALPVVLHLHGGGWILGDVNTHDRLAREIANGANAAVFVVDYERSPEAKYPVAIEQAYAVTNYIAEHAKELNVDASRMSVIGDSAGGDMAAVLTMLLKERGGPALKSQVLFYPVTDASLDTESFKEFANGPWLTKAAIEWMWNSYVPDVAMRKHRHVSPLQATVEQLKGLPKALVMTVANDVLRDEGEAYAAKLAEAGVDVTAVRYLGTIHDFVLLNPIANTPPVRGAIEQANNFLRRTLAK